MKAMAHQEHNMMFVALCGVIAFAVTPCTATAAESFACSPPATFTTCTLRAAGVRDPTTMAASLLRAELRTVSDVAGLDSAEAAELFDGLRAEGVPLGDRSRLRKLPRASHLTGLSAPIAQSRSPLQLPLSGSSSFVEESRQANRRQLQKNQGGISIEVAAIFATGLIGMAGYLVQARSVQKASDAQASTEREAAERDRVVAKAGKQLERVQLQMENCVQPLVAYQTIATAASVSMAFELGLEGYTKLHAFELIHLPATPYVTICNTANPATWKAIASAPFSDFPPEDLAMLAALALDVKVILTPCPVHSFVIFTVHK